MNTVVDGGNRGCRESPRSSRGTIPSSLLLRVLFYFNVGNFSKRTWSERVFSVSVTDDFLPIPKIDTPVTRW